MPAARSGANTPVSLAATAGVRMGMRAATRAGRIHDLRGVGLRVAYDICGRDPATSASGHFTGMPTRSLQARGAVAPGDNFPDGRVGLGPARATIWIGPISRATWRSECRWASTHPDDSGHPESTEP